MNFEEIRAWLLEHKGDAAVSAFLSEITVKPEITVEDHMKWLDGEEGQKAIQPTVDKRVQQAVQKRDTYHEERLDGEVKKRVAAEVLRLNPTETPEQKALRESNERIDRMQKEWELDKRKRVLAEKAVQLGVEAFFIDDFVPASDEQSELFLKKIKDHDKMVAEKAVNDLIASDAYVPRGGDDHGGKKKKGSVNLANLSQKEIDDLEASGQLDALIENS